jgi:predicted acyltransferase (DUF342 family)
MKKALKLLMVMLLAIGAGSFLITGCDSPTDGDRGNDGASGTIYLDGPRKTATINNAIATGAPLEFIGVTQSDEGVVIIPAGRNVKLVGEEAYTTYSSAGGILVVVDNNSVTGSCRLVSDHVDSPVIAPENVRAGGTTVVRIQEGGEAIDLTENTLAVRGSPLTISTGTTSSTNIKNDALSGKTLYVVGPVTVSADISGGPGIRVVGNVSVTVVQSSAIDWYITGDLTADKLPTIGSVEVRGNAVFAEAVSTIAGDIDIGGNATFNAALTTLDSVNVEGNLAVTGAVILGEDLYVGGTATLGGTLINAAGVTANAYFDGSTTITGVLSTAASGGLLIGGEGSVNLVAIPSLTNGALTIANTAGVTIPSAVIPDAKSIALATGGKIIITGTEGITAGKTKIEGRWEAVGSGAGTVTILSSTNGATITAATNATGLKASAAGATITQVEGSGNTLVISQGTTIDLSAGGSIKLLKHATEGGSINLSHSTAKIIGLTGGASNQTLVAGNISTATFTVGDDAAGKVIGTGSTAGAGNGIIVGGNDGGPNPIKAKDNNADAVINKDTVVGA